MAELELASGDRKKAMENLKVARRLTPDVAEWLLEDDAFARLREDGEIAALLREAPGGTGHG